MNYKVYLMKVHQMSMKKMITKVMRMKKMTGRHQVTIQETLSEVIYKLIWTQTTPNLINSKCKCKKKSKSFQQMTLNPSAYCSSKAG